MWLLYWLALVAIALFFVWRCVPEFRHAAHIGLVVVGVVVGAVLGLVLAKCRRLKNKIKGIRHKGKIMRPPHRRAFGVPPKTTVPHRKRIHASEKASNQESIAQSEHECLAPPKQAEHEPTEQHQHDSDEPVVVELLPVDVNA